MRKSYFLFYFLFLTILAAPAQNLLNCDFTVAAKACVSQEIKVTYTGGASLNATYTWNFDGANVISGSGQGPYFVQWTAPGEKHITLSILLEGQTCTATRPVVVVVLPQVFNMTGGGAIVAGSSGVAVGLSGSETGVVYKLRLNGQFTGVSVVGTGQHISFGLQTAPGNYTAVAKVDGADCSREMDGVAVVTSSTPPPTPYICMVTFDTAANMNKIIWNKHPGLHVSHYNVFKETYQNNVFSKIGEVPYSNLSVFADPTSDPLVKSDKFRISATDSAGLESEKSPFHKTIHLNINPGINGFNLIWNHYEGFDFLTYRIHRKHNGSAWEVVDSVASNVNSYTDLYSESGITTYYIEVLRIEPCNPSLKISGYMSVLSNTAAAAPLGLGESGSGGIFTYPNPVSQLLNIQIPAQGVFQYEILRSDGLTIMKGQISGPKSAINVSSLANGLYILKITGDNTGTVRKFVKN